MTTNRKTRVRWQLLALLWVWAILVFAVVDLFLNASGLDAVRPRSELYRSMRYAGHKLVGTPYLEGGFADEIGPALLARGEHRPVDAEELRAALAMVRDLENQRAVEALREQAQDGFDPRVRIHALRSLTKLEGAAARETLLAVVRNGGEAENVRVQAALFVGRTGEGALEALETILGSSLSGQVRAGAVLGLGELDTAPAAVRAFEIAAGPKSRLQSASVSAIERMTSAETAPVLIAAVQDRKTLLAARVAACRGLGAGRRPEAVPVLMEILGSGRYQAPVCQGAAEALGRIGNREALEVVTSACRHWNEDVAREAKLARVRLAQVPQ